uniref:hypothetical protein n=1 Tax=Psychrobacter sp. TaxID=56811 RepID=UPI001597FC24|nr:hypothetical protein [Psychrobacter sp.]QJS05774.1 hypothetical protein [Psychrobacter sp.]
MTTGASELNTQDFIAEFGQHELVSDFSEEAINAILSQYKRVQSESKSNDPSAIDWEPLFNDALEWDASGVVYELNSEVKEHASEIINMIRTADIAISADAKEKISNLEHGLNDEELLLFFKPELMKSPDYFNKVAAILARENNFTKLDNGKYLILGAY